MGSARGRHPPTERRGRPWVDFACRVLRLPPAGHHKKMTMNHTTNPPTPCLWQAPASTQKTKRKTRPAIRRGARWRVRGGGGGLTLGSQPGALRARLGQGGQAGPIPGRTAARSWGFSPAPARPHTHRHPRPRLPATRIFPAPVLPIPAVSPHPWSPFPRTFPRTRAPFTRSFPALW